MAFFFFHHASPASNKTIKDSATQEKFDSKPSKSIESDPIDLKTIFEIPADYLWQ